MKGKHHPLLFKLYKFDLVLMQIIHTLELYFSFQVLGLNTCNLIKLRLSRFINFYSNLIYSEGQEPGCYCLSSYVAERVN